MYCVVNLCWTLIVNLDLTLNALHNNNYTKVSVHVGYNIIRVPHYILTTMKADILLHDNYAIIIIKQKAKHGIQNYT